MFAEKQRDRVVDRSHALRGNASMDALRPLGTRSVPGCIPTQSVTSVR